MTIEASIWVAVIDRLRALAGGADQPLLHDRHLGQRHFDPEVAAGDHDPAGRRLDDLLDVVRPPAARSILAISGMSEPSSASRSRDRLQVGGGGDEGDGEQVDAVLDRELDPAEVDRRSPPAGRRRRGCSSPCARRACRRPRPRSRPRRPRARRPAGGSRRRRGRRAGPRCRSVTPGQETGIVSRSPSTSRGVRVTCIPVSSSAKSSRSSPIRSFGPGRSPSIATSRPTATAAAADRLDRLRLFVGAGVGEVEAEDVGAGGDQLLEHAALPAGRADRGDDLGAPLEVGAELVDADGGQFRSRSCARRPDRERMVRRPDRWMRLPRESRIVR